MAKILWKSRCCLILSLIISAELFTIPDLCAQNLVIRDLESQETDSGKVDWRKPNYLPINQNEILKNFEKEPSFGIFRDNYFITGVPTNKKVNKSTADVKFQVSIRQLTIEAEEVRFGVRQ